MATRRAFLAGMMAASLPRTSWAAAGSPAFLAAAKTGDASQLPGLTEAGESLFALPLPARGHAAAAHPTRAEAVAFARRPGVFALVIDCVSGTVKASARQPWADGQSTIETRSLWISPSSASARLHRSDAPRKTFAIWPSKRYNSRSMMPASPPVTSTG